MREADLVRAAFRDLHGPSLHGFALLVSLGDPEPSERIASTVLAEGTARADELRHPERAAAWLRARVLQRLIRRRIGGRAYRRSEGMAVLRGIGVSELTANGLAALSLERRAALVASSIERFGAIDLETILGRPRHRVRRIVAEARARYLHAVLDASEEPPSPRGGPLARRVDAASARALGRKIGAFHGG